MLNDLLVLADSTTQSTGGGPGGLFSSPILPFLVIMLIFMFFMSSSKRKQEKAKQQLLKSMKKGDRVQTIGGILGTIVDVRDDEVVVKVDETNNTKIKFARSAVSRVVTEEDKAETKS